ncbi:Protein of unknown function, partial [Cotesia congregata]
NYKEVNIIDINNYMICLGRRAARGDDGVGDKCIASLIDVKFDFFITENRLHHTAIAKNIPQMAIFSCQKSNVTLQTIEFKLATDK